MSITRSYRLQVESAVGGGGAIGLAIDLYNVDLTLIDSSEQAQGNSSEAPSGGASLTTKTRVSQDCSPRGNRG
jgi:hypothetical protein